MANGMNTGFEGTRRKYDTAVFDKHLLSNGVTVWLQKSPILTDEEGIIIGFLPNVGSRTDPWNAHGMAHFLEHMPFCGTKGKPDKDAIYKPLQEWGGWCNANTNQHRTAYMVGLPGECFELAAETLYELIANPLFDGEAIAIERDVIIEEHEQYFSSSRNIAARHILKSFFGKYPIGHHPVGEISVLLQIKRGQLLEFHKKHYHGGNLQIICGGSFSKRKDALKIIKRYFDVIRGGEKTILDKMEILPYDDLWQYVIEDKSCKRDIMEYLWPIPPLSDLSEITLRFFANALAGHLNSPLIEELRSRRGLVYESGLSSLRKYPDFCLFSVVFPVDKKHFKTVNDVFYDVMENLSSEYLVAQQRANQIRRMMSFSNPISECKNIIEDITTDGRPYSFREIEDLKDRIRSEEVYKWRDYIAKTAPFKMYINGK